MHFRLTYLYVTVQAKLFFELKYVVKIALLSFPTNSTPSSWRSPRSWLPSRIFCLSHGQAARDPGSIGTAPLPHSTRQQSDGMGGRANCWQHIISPNTCWLYSLPAVGSPGCGTSHRAGLSARTPVPVCALSPRRHKPRTACPPTAKRGLPLLPEGRRSCPAGSARPRQAPTRLSPRHIPVPLPGQAQSFQPFVPSAPPPPAVCHSPPSSILCR